MNNIYKVQNIFVDQIQTWWSDGFKDPYNPKFIPDVGLPSDIAWRISPGYQYLK